MEFMPYHHESAESVLDTDNLNAEELIFHFGFNFKELKSMAEESRRYLAMLEAVDKINSEKTANQLILVNTAATFNDMFEFYREDSTSELKKFGTIEFPEACEDFLGDRLIVHDNEVFLQNDTINLALKVWSPVEIIDKPGTRVYQNETEERFSQTRIRQNKYDSCLWYQDLIAKNIVEEQTVRVLVEHEF